MLVYMLKGGGGSILIFFLYIEDDWSGLQRVHKVVLHRKIREVLSVYSIHTCTLSLSKGVDIAIFNLVNWKADTLFTMLCNSLIRLIVIFRLFNTNEIYIIKSITFMNKQNNFHNDLSSFFDAFLKSRRIFNKCKPLVQYYFSFVPWCYPLHDFLKIWFFAFFLHTLYQSCL